MRGGVVSVWEKTGWGEIRLLILSHNTESDRSLPRKNLSINLVTIWCSLCDAEIEKES